jgi:5-oxoprolinase (ATP-hydrolysing) subunit A
MCSRDPELAEAVARSIAEVDPDLLLLLLREDVLRGPARHGVRVVAEAFVDLDYDADGELIIEAVKTARDPEQVAARALRLVRERKLTKIDGSDFEVDVPTLCLHGDAPNAVDVARAVRRRLEDEGIAIRPLGELLGEPAAR